jgi:hypothetical protein
MPLEVDVISFELSDADQLQIYLDLDGLADLAAQIKLLNDRKTDHVHLMSESWGGSHLEEKPLNEAAKPIRHVKIIMRG